VNPPRAGQKDTPKAASTHSPRGSGRVAKKRVRIIKKVRIAGGLWKFISLDRIRGSVRLGQASWLLFS
jgi:hypothetical protein